MILEKTVELIKQIYRYTKIFPPKITKVIIGLGYTAVEATTYGYDPFLGVAYSLPSVIKQINCSKIEFAGKLTNKSLDELLDWCCGAPSLKKIIGIATLHAEKDSTILIKACGRDADQAMEALEQLITSNFEEV